MQTQKSLASSAPAKTASQFQIAVMDGRQVRKFVTFLKKLGAPKVYDKPVLKRVDDADGEKLFSAIKYSSGWDCRVHVLLLADLKRVLNLSPSFRAWEHMLAMKEGHDGTFGL